MVSSMLSKSEVASGTKQVTGPRVSTKSPGRRPPGTSRASATRTRPTTTSVAPPIRITRPNWPRSPIAPPLLVVREALVEAADQAEDYHEDQRRDQHRRQGTNDQPHGLERVDQQVHFPNTPGITPLSARLSPGGSI